MKKLVSILFFLLFVSAAKPTYSQSGTKQLTINLYGDSVSLPRNATFTIPFDTLSDEAIQRFYAAVNNADIEPLISFLTKYKRGHALNDWFYYQLIRKTAEAISPKAQNYYRYTLYKWLLLGKSGYDAVLRNIANKQLLLYVQSNDSVYNIPFQISDGKQYVCLNYHDYGTIDATEAKKWQTTIHIPEASKMFSYRITNLPSFDKSLLIKKELQFSYKGKEYRFTVKLNPVVKDIFANYPVVDFESCFNIPFSKETYASLMPGLKKITEKMDQQTGIDYLMHFTRYAFPFENDSKTFGREKRLAPEETLLYDHSDCEDRAALFFYLVKELYNLPMITLLYPEHVTVAIAFPKPVGKTISYNGKRYTVCEPTPQGEDLKIGQLPAALRHAAYDVGYEYIPVAQAVIPVQKADR